MGDEGGEEGKDEGEGQQVDQQADEHHQGRAVLGLPHLFFDFTGLTFFGQSFSFFLSRIAIGVFSSPAPQLHNHFVLSETKHFRKISQQTFHTNLHCDILDFWICLQPINTVKSQ